MCQGLVPEQQNWHYAPLPLPKILRPGGQRGMRHAHRPGRVDAHICACVGILRRNLREAARESCMCLFLVGRPIRAERAPLSAPCAWQHRCFMKKGRFQRSCAETCILTSIRCGGRLPSLFATWRTFARSRYETLSMKTHPPVKYRLLATPHLVEQQQVWGSGARYCRLPYPRQPCP